MFFTIPLLTGELLILTYIPGLQVTNIPSFQLLTCPSSTFRILTLPRLSSSKAHFHSNLPTFSPSHLLFPPSAFPLPTSNDLLTFFLFTFFLSTLTFSFQLSALLLLLLALPIYSIFVKYSRSAAPHFPSARANSTNA